MQQFFCGFVKSIVSHKYYTSYLVWSDFFNKIIYISQFLLLLIENEYNNQNNGNNNRLCIKECKKRLRNSKSIAVGQSDIIFAVSRAAAPRLAPDR